MARIPKVPKTPKAPKAPKGPTQAPQAPAGKEKFLDRMGRYALYGQAFGNDGANMTTGQRIGGAAYSAFEQATLGQMGTLGKAMSAGISARGKKDQAGGSGPHDTQDIQFQQIKGDDVVAAINQSTRQMVAGLNTVNHTLGRGFNRLGDDIQAQGQALNSIVAANEDVAIQMREMLEQLNKMAYDRGGGGGANASTLAGRGGGPDGGPAGGSGGGILGNLLNILLTGAGLASGAAALKKLFGIGDDPDGKTPKGEDPDGKKTKVKEPPVKPEEPKKPKGEEPDGKKIKGKAPPATPGGSWYDDAMKAFKNTTKSLGSKIATPVLAAIAIWNAWEEISALDDTMPLEKYREQVAKIIGRTVGEFGLVLVGGIIGAIIAGAVSGPGAIVGLIGGMIGGIAADYALGDSVDAIVDAVISFLYKGTNEPAKKPATENKKVSATNPKITRVSSSDATQIPSESSESLIPEDANPIRNGKGEIIGYQPAGGGPTVALKGREEELRSLRSSAVNNYTDDAIRLLQKKQNKEQIAKDLGISSEDADTAAPDAAPVKAAPPVGEQPDNWDEEFYSKFPEWMNVKNLDYPPSRLMDSPTGLQGPDTTEEKLKEQEKVAEEAQKEQIASDVLINAKELIYKADKIIFDTDSLEFNYSKLTQTVKKTAGETPTANSGVSPSARLPGGATPGSEAEAARSPSGVTPGTPGDMPKLEALDAGKARENAEKYLGRKMTDQEYDYLMRATHAEAAAGKKADPREQAMIMASILNRARDMGENGVIKALTAKNQFQAVTGTKYAPGPSANFTKGPDAERQASIEASSQMLSAIPQEQKNFTAASSGAYGPGTNIGYRDKMIEAGGTTIGGSVFNTNPNFNTQSAPDAGAAQPQTGGPPGTRLPGGEQPGAGAAAGLNFAQGVDKNINSGIAEKVQQIQSAFGSSLTISSGYRDPARNKKAGGAKNSAHMRKNAVDIKFNGGIPETLNFIKIASQMGIGGIGVYRPGSIHLDTENRRAWGPSYGRSSVPAWAEEAIRAHESGQMGAYDPSAAGSGSGDATMESGGAPAGAGAGPAPGGGGAPGAVEGGGGASGNPLASMLGGGGSPFGAVGSMLGGVLGSMSADTSFNASSSKGAGSTTNIVNNSSRQVGENGTGFPVAGSPQPAMSSMFARLFDGSAMFG